MEAYESRSSIVVTVDSINPREEDIAPVADAARRGQPVVFPTDTVYGIGTNAEVPGAVLDIFQVKGRPANKPLILLIADPDDVYAYVEKVSDFAKDLIAEYWPGPLTLIFNKSERVRPEVAAGGTTVGVRCPDNAVARMLIRLTGTALATTSANISGQPSPKNAAEAKENLWGRVAYIIDGGEVRLGIESTVLDVSSDEPKLIREGYLPWSELQKKMK